MPTEEQQKKINRLERQRVAIRVDIHSLEIKVEEISILIKELRD